MCTPRLVNCCWWFVSVVTTMGERARVVMSAGTLVVRLCWNWPKSGGAFGWLAFTTTKSVRTRWQLVIEWQWSWQLQQQVLETWAYFGLNNRNKQWESLTRIHQTQLQTEPLTKPTQCALLKLYMLCFVFGMLHILLFWTGWSGQWSYH